MAGQAEAGDTTPVAIIICDEMVLGSRTATGDEPPVSCRMGVISHSSPGLDPAPPACPVSCRGTVPADD